ncbi:MAG: aconitate hydratase AcnA, partial [Gemmatimonadetes bacterium]|nr:aconitate hydratase AcnA [Gemmatimonadota bacterium]
FVEFYGPGLARLPLADRATIGNMAPEYGATCGIFPVDAETVHYLEFTGRPPEQLELVAAYLKEQGLFRSTDSPAAEYSDSLELELGSVEPSLAGPRRPQDRVRLSAAKQDFQAQLERMLEAAPAGGGMVRGAEQVGVGAATAAAIAAGAPAGVRVVVGGEPVTLDHGSVVIAAITSCTNTSNPSVMVAAGLLARNAVERGLGSQPWVKTSLAPGSKVVMDYLTDAGLVPYLEQLGFHLVGYGCTTCIGNSGPLPPAISAAIEEGGLVAVSVLSGNRNFEGRINPDVRANYLASPPLVVAYALAGRMDVDLYNEPLGRDAQGRSVFLKDVWPTQHEVQQVMQRSVRSEMFRKQYAHVFEGDERWTTLPAPGGELFEWDADSTYVKEPPYFLDMPEAPPAVQDVSGARVLALLGDSITTDHISPAGSIKPDSPAGRYLLERGVARTDFNSYGARRGNHEVMMRGTFANIRLRNALVPGLEGGYTVHFPTGERMSIFDAAMKYAAENVPLLVIAGKEYGTGSSRDWAAKGPRLLGVRSVMAESYERIHRSNLVGMGVLPLEFRPGESAASLGLTGTEEYQVLGLADGVAAGFRRAWDVTVRARRTDGSALEFRARARVDTPQELEYYRHGGILPYVLRQLVSRTQVPA